jgi:uncharacterized protein (DUF486 family)
LAKTLARRGSARQVRFGGRGCGLSPLRRVTARLYSPPRIPSPKAAMFPAFPVPVVTIGLLIASNVFMTFAWYGHLRFKAVPLLAVIAISWLIALPEYALQVPANRIGHGYFSAAELKTIQEVITLTVFAVFSVTYLGEAIRWNHAVGFALIALGAGFVFKPF